MRNLQYDKENKLCIRYKARKKMINDIRNYQMNREIQRQASVKSGVQFD